MLSFVGLLGWMIDLTNKIRIIMIKVHTVEFPQIFFLFFFLFSVSYIRSTIGCCTYKKNNVVKKDIYNFGTDSFQMICSICRSIITINYIYQQSHNTLVLLFTSRTPWLVNFFRWLGEGTFFFSCHIGLHNFVDL